MKGLLLFTAIALAGSFFRDRAKTWAGLRKGLGMFWGIFPDLMMVLVFAAAFLAYVPASAMAKMLGPSTGFMGMLAAAGIGAVALVPGFIAFPMAALLLRTGVGLPVVAVFITTLMMVGVVTLPMEARYFGWRTALARNAMSFGGALIVGYLLGWIL